MPGVVTSHTTGSPQTLAAREKIGSVGAPPLLHDDRSHVGGKLHERRDILVQPPRFGTENVDLCAVAESVEQIGVLELLLQADAQPQSDWVHGRHRALSAPDDALHLGFRHGIAQLLPGTRQAVR